MRAIVIDVIFENLLVVPWFLPSKTSPTYQQKMHLSFVLTAFLASVSLATTYSNSSFDYVIVGGGTAGLALANRLSANSSVAVIEAGGFYQAVDNGTAQVPGLDILGAGMSPDDVVDTDWRFVTQPQAGANGRELHYARGKCLGGRYV
jgi:GMC oxidoreductase